jgi:hypothetical protein
MTPLFLSRTVMLESIDPQSRNITRIEANPTKVAAITPATAVGTMVATDHEGFGDDINAAFCSHVHHFVNRRSATAFAESDSRRYLMEVEELRKAAESLFHAVWA